MLFFTAAVQVGRIADMGFDFLFAVAEIVVGNNGHNHALHVAAHQFKRLAVVVQFVFLLPAHAVFALALGRIVNMGQAEIFFPAMYQMRRQDDAAGMACPMLNIQGGIVFGQERVACVAENGLDKIQVGDQSAGGEKAHFQGFDRHRGGNFRADNRAQQRGYPEFCRVSLRAGKGQAQQVGWRQHCGTE